MKSINFSWYFGQYLFIPYIHSIWSQLWLRLWLWLCVLLLCKSNFPLSPARSTIHHPIPALASRVERYTHKSWVNTQCLLSREYANFYEDFGWQKWSVQFKLHFKLYMKAAGEKGQMEWKERIGSLEEQHIGSLVVDRCANSVWFDCTTKRALMIKMCAANRYMHRLPFLIHQRFRITFDRGWHNGLVAGGSSGSAKSIVYI